MEAQRDEVTSLKSHSQEKVEPAVSPKSSFCPLPHLLVHHCSLVDWKILLKFHPHNEHTGQGLTGIYTERLFVQEHEKESRAGSQGRKEAHHLFKGRDLWATAIVWKPSRLTLS